jgi:hypothetical protein
VRRSSPARETRLGPVLLLLRRGRRGAPFPEHWYAGVGTIVQADEILGHPQIPPRGIPRTTELDVPSSQRPRVDLLIEISGPVREDYDCLHRARRMDVARGVPVSSFRLAQKITDKGFEMWAWKPCRPHSEIPSEAFPFETNCGTNSGALIASCRRAVIAIQEYYERLDGRARRRSRDFDDGHAGGGHRRLVDDVELE